jgi:hypothetical protein
MLYNLLHVTWTTAPDGVARRGALGADDSTTSLAAFQATLLLLLPPSPSTPLPKTPQANSETLRTYLTPMDILEAWRRLHNFVTVSWHPSAAAAAAAALCFKLYRQTLSLCVPT